MQYLVIGRDYPNALPKRLAARSAHIALGDKLRDEGKLLFGVAILDEAGQMAGSTLICDFSSRQELDDWLAIEPYATQGVWEHVTIELCRVGPSFAHLLPAGDKAKAV